MTDFDWVFCVALLLLIVAAWRSEISFQRALAKAIEFENSDEKKRLVRELKEKNE